MKTFQLAPGVLESLELAASNLTSLKRGLSQLSVSGLTPLEPFHQLYSTLEIHQRLLEYLLLELSSEG